MHKGTPSVLPGPPPGGRAQRAGNSQRCGHAVVGPQVLPLLERFWDQRASPMGATAWNPGRGLEDSPLASSPHVGPSAGRKLFWVQLLIFWTPPAFVDSLLLTCPHPPSCLSARSFVHSSSPRPLPQFSHLHAPSVAPPAAMETAAPLPLPRQQAITSAADP